MHNIYTHKVQYYETDKMGITHHSNYIRFLEEARTDILEKCGFSYDRMEKEKVFIPTVRVEVDYKKTTTYGDVLEIDGWVSSLTAARMELGYNIYRDGEVVCTAKTVHCFLNDQGRPVAIKKYNKEVYDVFNSLLREGSNE